MKSPFPGMDPYIEQCRVFEDFHFDLISEMKRNLAESVPSRYLVRTGERSYVVLVEGEGKKEHAFLPDVGIVSPTSPTPAGAIATAILADPKVDAEAVSMQAFISMEYRENFIEIYDTEPDRSLITCIEVLSPSNKRGGSPGWDLYLRKRQGILMGTANLVELDLLRGGTKMPMMDSWPNSPYSLLVARKLFAPGCRVWPAHFRRPLPTIPIPLTHPDPDVHLNLQPMVDALYSRFHYERDIDYLRPLTPPLTDEETAWLAEQLKQRQSSP